MLEKLRDRPVRHIAQGPRIYLSPDVRVEQAIERMRSHHWGAVIIVDDDNVLAGIFTERDVLIASSKGDPQWRQKPLGEVMTPNPSRLGNDAPISEALRQMQRGRFRHLPLVDEHNRPIGIISIQTILAYVAKHFPQEFLNLPPEPSLEAKRLYGG